MEDSDGKPQRYKVNEDGFFMLKDGGLVTNPNNEVTNSENYKEALNCYNKALEIEPNFGAAWYRKGMVIGVLGDFQEAIKCHEKALSIEPDFIDAIFSKGMALGIVGETEMGSKVL
ncbi:hypothetical protein LCGC14_0720330 [marine sediment metagenome]|uniref:Uncharacterized protein n=1 Tax=marine sediment metagenome TaxID=412755 RepID=A0A0F9QCJ3_9ZZZZ